MSAHKILPCGPPDFEQMFKVWDASVRASHDFLTAGQIDALAPLVPSAFQRADHVAGVRDETGRLIGFVGVTGENLDMLFIHPSAWRQGIGKALYLHARDRLGARTVDVNEDNGDAIAFYKRMGARFIGRSEFDDFGNPYPLLHFEL